MAPSPAVETRRLMRSSVWSALCPLLPLPLVDDFFLGQVRQRGVADLLSGRGRGARGDEVKLLALGPGEPPIRGCVDGCWRWGIVWPLRFVFVYVLKKLLRKILFVLTFKDCVDAFSRSFHQNWLLRHALELGFWPQEGAPAADRQAQLEHLRAAIDASLTNLGHTPFDAWARAILRRSWRSLKAAAGAVARGLRSRPKGEQRIDDELERDSAGVDAVVDDLTENLDAESAYLRRLEQHFEERLAGWPPPPPPPQ